MKGSETRKSWFGLKVLGGLTLLVLLLYLVGSEELLSALKNLTVEMVIVLLGLSGLLVWVSAIKWRQFLVETAPGTIVPSTWQLSGLYLVGYFVNLLAPSFVGGDAVRSYYAGRVTGQHAAAAATILERFTGLVAMLALGIVIGWSSSLVSGRIYFALLGISALLAVLSCFAVHTKSSSTLLRLPWGKRIAGHLERVQAGFNLARANRRLLLKAMALSFLFHSLTVCNTVAAAWAVGWESVPLDELFVVLPIILLLGAIPISPSGLGIQEGAFLYFLQGLGATPGQALAVGLVLRAKSYILAALGGLVFVMLRRR